MHRLGEDHLSYAWDRDAQPALTVSPGATVELAVREASDGQLSPTSTNDDVAALDDTRANHGPGRGRGGDGR